MRINFLETLHGRISTVLVAGVVFAMFSCSDDSSSSSGAAYDPDKPITLESFTPTEGAMATQVILKGGNFGNIADSVKVFFNEKEAPVISAKGDRMLVLAPKLPGDNCIIKVRIGKQESAFTQVFDYHIQTNVTTIVGGDRNSKVYPTGTMDLAEVQFNNNLDRPIVIDKENNIYLMLNNGTGSDADYVVCLNESAGKLRVVKESCSTWLNSNFLTYDCINDRCYRFMSNVGMLEYYFFDKNNDFTDTQGGKMQFEGAEMNPGGWNSWSARHAMAMRPSDGHFYLRVDGGFFAHFDPKTGRGENITGKYASMGFGSKNGQCDGIAFDPADPDILYFAVNDRNCIFRYSFKTEELEVYAGSAEADAGYMDGERLEALFNKPEQICIDEDRNMYIADSNNHCIRKIVLSTGYVSTVAGVPEESGYVNGTGEVAKFDNPIGIAVSKDGVLYVGDSYNRALRRIAIE